MCNDLSVLNILLEAKIGDTSNSYWCIINFENDFKKYVFTYMHIDCFKKTQNKTPWKYMF